MVQRLYLFGAVSLEERPMLSKCLRSISGMNPRTLDRERQIWMPKFRYDASKSAKPSQSAQASQPAQVAQSEQYRLFVVKSGDSTSIESYEVPEAGKNIKVVSQSILSSEIASKDVDVGAFMAELGYEPQATHFVKGDEYVLHEYIIVHLFQLYDENGDLLDKSEQSTIIAYVDIESVRDLAAVERGTRMLLSIQQELRGVATLQMPNRNSFSSRVPRLQSSQV